MVVCLKQAFSKVWILCSKNLVSIFSLWVFSGTAFWGSWEIEKKPFGFSECPSITSATCSYQWSTAVPLVPCCACHAVATVARSISPEHALPPREGVSLFSGAQEQPQSTHAAVLDIAPVMCWELASFVPWTCWGLLFQPQWDPQVLCSQWSSLDFTSFSFFLGEI